MTTAVAKAKTLSVQQSLFVDGLMLGKNATQAYIDAGYSARGAQPGSARLLSNVMVAAEVAKRKEEYSRNAGITRTWILENYKKRIEAKLSDLFDANGALLPPKQWPEHLQDVVLKVKVQEMQGGMAVASDAGPVHVPMFTKEVALEPKLQALGKLLDWVEGVVAPPPANVINAQFNVDKLLLALPGASIPTQ